MHDWYILAGLLHGNFRWRRMAFGEINKLNFIPHGWKGNTEICGNSIPFRFYSDSMCGAHENVVQPLHQTFDTRCDTITENPFLYGIININILLWIDYLTHTQERARAHSWHICSLKCNTNDVWLHSLSFSCFQNKFCFRFFLNRFGMNTPFR